MENLKENLRNFLKKASRISSNPLDRVPDEMKRVLKTSRINFDVHCHVFNIDTIPKKYLVFRIPHSQRYLKLIVFILHVINNYSDHDPFSNYGYLVNLMSKSTNEITLKLFSYYKDKPTIFCPLMMDLKPGFKSDAEISYDTQIDQMRDLRNKHPDKLLPFLAIDPNNYNVCDHFLKAFSKEYNFFGIKIYPSLGYLPSNPILMKIFQICEEKRIPVTTHNGDGRVHSATNYFYAIKGKRINNSGQLEKILDRRFFLTPNSYAYYFNEPKRWEPVLKCFPKLKLNLAHFGNPYQWKKMVKGKSQTWVHDVISIMEKYEYVYADTSYLICFPKIYQLIKESILGKQLILERTLYGSDYYMMVIEGHFRDFKLKFHNAMGDEIINQIEVENPKKFLFSE